MPAAVVRAGVVLCVAIALGTAVVKLPDVLGVFDARADANAALTYAQRSHTHPEWAPESGNVLETARLWMPEDAEYRVVYGPGFDHDVSADFTHHFLYGFLLPRHPTRSERAPWVFCYGCDEQTLAKLEVLAAVEGGPTFGRVLQ